MKFSLFFEMQIADPTRASEAQLFRDCLAQAELADSVGFDGVWAVEHHGLYEYAHCSAPEIFLSFVAARTKKIAIGHGVTLLPGRYNHPIRVAERIATLDILSGGRVIWGTGKSGTKVEQGAFELDPSTLESQWLEALHMIPRMWREEIFEWDGKFYKIPPTRIIPKPVQDPHPPIFAACSRPELAVGAGELGLGVLNFALYEDSVLKERVNDYRAAIARAKPAGESVTNRFCCNPAALVLRDDKKASEYGLRGSTYFLRSMMHYYLTEKRPTGGVVGGRQMPTERTLEAFRSTRNKPGTQLSTVIGDPACARETIQRFKDAGVDELVFMMQTGTQPHELIMESIRTMAEDVFPHFK
ncbi:MAG: LLM class flavin-dependent oxidoreductase [Bdellovibrionales bacterium]|nr:LLM class flavin-dependent oxidoreductase [Bdellovibrionales bacterium]